MDSLIPEEEDKDKLRNWFRTYLDVKEENRGDILLDIRNVSFGYTEDHKNLENVSLAIREGEMVSIASVLVQNPEMIILDEPTAGQDLKHYTEIMEFLKELNKQGLTIVLVTHDMHLMLEYTSRALVFARRKLIADKRPAKVLCRPDLIHRASLKETSLFKLADRCGIDPPEMFVECFIKSDREVRSYGS